jgi:hypothetical protein
MNLENKKIPTSIIIASILLLVITTLTKSVKKDLFREWFFYQEKNVSVGTNFYCINLFGIEIPYSLVLTVLIIIFGTGVLMLLYKTDDEVKNAINMVVQKSKSTFGKLQSSISKTTQKASSNVTKLKDIKPDLNNEYEKYMTFSVLSLILFIPLCFFEYYVELENYILISLAIITFLSKKVVALIITKKLTPFIKGEAWFWKLLSICFPTITLFILSTKFFEKKGLIIKSS